MVCFSVSNVSIYFSCDSVQVVHVLSIIFAKKMSFPHLFLFKQNLQTIVFALFPVPSEIRICYEQNQIEQPQGLRHNEQTSHEDVCVSSVQDPVRPKFILLPQTSYIKTRLNGTRDTYPLCSSPFQAKTFICKIIQMWCSWLHVGGP